LKSVATTFLIR